MFISQHFRLGHFPAPTKFTRLSILMEVRLVTSVITQELCEPETGLLSDQRHHRPVVHRSLVSSYLLCLTYTISRLR